jgi:hypothetical protein
MQVWSEWLMDDLRKSVKEGLYQGNKEKLELL